MKRFRFSPAFPRTTAFTLADGAILVAIAGVLYVAARLAFRGPQEVAGPAIALAPRALPWYALLSVLRMLGAYVLSLAFTFGYGYAAARSRTAEIVLMPLLDVFQSVPILSFLPVVLLGLSSVLPPGFASELAAVVLIFTSQAWNMTFSYYQSLTTIPLELREAAAVFRFDPWLRLKTLELPFAAIGLIWNSMMSWSGGWFFLMAAESFRVGARDFRLPGLGSYLQTAASAGDLRAVAWGVATLVAVIVALDQLVWRPVLSWAEKFKLEMSEGDEPQQSWFRELMSHSRIVEALDKPSTRVAERVDGELRNRLGPCAPPEPPARKERVPIPLVVGGALAGAVVVYLGWRAIALLATLDVAAWKSLAVGIAATLARVAGSLALALLWTIPVGVAIGTNRRLATVLQPAVQVAASIPATALFPVLLLGLLRVPGGLNIAAVTLMLLGTQWYLLFNIIAGATAIPQDLRAMSSLLRLSRWERWRTLVLPAIFPYVVTGAITASGGAWNASIIAERVEFGGATHATTGVGALIAQATDDGRYALLLAGTLLLVSVVVLINRTFWLRLYRVAEDRYRME